MLFVTHDVLEAVQLSDRIIIVAYGGRNYADIPIDLPYPRLQTDREVATIQADILEVFNDMEPKRKAATRGSPSSPRSPGRWRTPAEPAGPSESRQRYMPSRRAGLCSRIAVLLLLREARHRVDPVDRVGSIIGAG